MNTTNDTRPFVPTQHDEIVELADGRALRLILEPDHDTTLEDFDCYGKFAWVDDYRNRDTGQSYRPKGFNGRARKLWTRADTFWWQPPADVDDSQLDDMAWTVRELMEFGFVVVVVELLGENEDYYGRRPVLDVLGAVGGVEWDVNESHLQDLVGDIVGERLDDADELVRW